MNFALWVIGTIKTKNLVKYLPQILAFILTRVIKWAAMNKPDLLTKIIFYTKKVSDVLDLWVKAGEDKVYEPAELKEIAEAWKKEM